MAEAERIGDILSRAVAPPLKKQRSLIARVKRGWVAAAGDELASHACPKGVRRGVLTVEVDSSSLLAELAGYRRQAVLRAIAAEPSCSGVRDVKFVLAENEK